MILATTLSSRWWGYAEADSTVVGVLVAAVAALAVLYLITGVVRSRRPGPRVRKHKGTRG